MDKVKVCGLANDDHVGRVGSHYGLQRDAFHHLFEGGGGDHHAPTQLRAVERGGGVHHGCERALHVGCATAIERVAVDLCAKGIMLPGRAGRNCDRVGVRVKQQRGAGLRPLYHADDAAVGVDRHAVIGQRAHLRLHARCHLLLLAAEAGQPHQRLGKLNKLLPIHVRGTRDLFAGFGVTTIRTSVSSTRGIQNWAFASPGSARKMTGGLVDW